jgi:phosphocarrier protein
LTEATFKILYSNGVHARPATMLVLKASGFRSNVYLTYKDVSVNMKSIMGVLSLSIPQGHPFKVTCSGEDENEALLAIGRIVQEINQMK